MSVSMRSTKAQMYAEIERLRDDAVDEIARLRAKHAVPNTQHHVPSTKQSLAQFCAAYCQTHGTRSVPGHVVNAWRICATAHPSSRLLTLGSRTPNSAPCSK